MSTNVRMKKSVLGASESSHLSLKKYTRDIKRNIPTVYNLQFQTMKKNMNKDAIDTFKRTE